MSTAEPAPAGAEAAGQSARVGDLTEEELLAVITPLLPRGPQTPVGESGPSSPLVLLLHVMHMRGALVLGMTAVGVLTWMAGFWEVPAAPFFQPEGLDTVIGALAFPSAEQLFPTAVLIFALLCALLLETGAVLALQEKGGADDKGSSGILMRLFSMSFLSSPT